MDLAFKTLRKAGGHIVPKVLETWLKGWVTSHRMQRPHTYLLARLQRAQRHAQALYHVPTYICVSFLLAEVSADSLVCFGLEDPSLQSMEISGCLLSAYHAVKAMVRSGIIHVHEESVTSATIRVIWKVFAKAFLVEPGGLHVGSCAFSLPKFIGFFASWILPLKALPNHISLHALNQ